MYLIYSRPSLSLSNLERNLIYPITGGNQENRFRNTRKNTAQHRPPATRIHGINNKILFHFISLNIFYFRKRIILFFLLLSTTIRNTNVPRWTCISFSLLRLLLVLSIRVTNKISGNDNEPFHSIAFKMLAAIDDKKLIKETNFFYLCVCVCITPVYFGGADAAAAVWSHRF